MTETISNNKITDQLSPGESMIEQENMTAVEGIISISVADINTFPTIPDYKGLSRIQKPIVIKTPATCICIDGYEIVEQAKAQGNKVIDCYAYCLNDCSDEEIAIRKVAVRMMPHAGVGSYIEIIRNVKILYHLLMQSKNVVQFAHGGDRKGDAFINNKDESIRFLLATRLGKSVSTISKYLNHVENLNAEAIEILITAGEQGRIKPNKEFFELGQSNRRKYLVVLKSRRLEENQITDEVSKLVLNMFLEYKSTGAIKNIMAAEDQPEVQIINPQQSTIPVEQSPVTAQTILLATERQQPLIKYITPPEPEIGSPVEAVDSQKDIIKNKTLAILNQMLGTLNSSGFRFHHLIDGVKNCIKDLLCILDEAQSINDESNQIKK